MWSGEAVVVRGHGLGGHVRPHPPHQAAPAMAACRRAVPAPRAADLLEVIEDRAGTRSTIVTSQLPVGHWHEALGEPTVADAILDRLVHNAFRLELKGDSRRRVETERVPDRPTSPGPAATDAPGRPRRDREGTDDPPASSPTAGPRSVSDYPTSTERR